MNIFFTSGIGLGPDTNAIDADPPEEVDEPEPQILFVDTLKLDSLPIFFVIPQVQPVPKNSLSVVPSDQKVTK